MTPKVDALPMKKNCPLCATNGDAVADSDGNHSGTWECKNTDCEKQFFASSVVQFYNPKRTRNKPGDGWTWNSIKDRYC